MVHGLMACHSFILLLHQGVAPRGCDELHRTTAHYGNELHRTTAHYGDELRRTQATSCIALMHTKATSCIALAPNYMDACMHEWMGGAWMDGW